MTQCARMDEGVQDGLMDGWRVYGWVDGPPGQQCLPGPISNEYHKGPAGGGGWTVSSLKEQVGSTWTKPSRPEFSNSLSQVVTNGKCRVTSVRTQAPRCFIHNLSPCWAWRGWSVSTD